MHISMLLLDTMQTSGFGASYVYYMYVYFLRNPIPLTSEYIRTFQTEYFMKMTTQTSFMRLHKSLHNDKMIPTLAYIGVIIMLINFTRDPLQKGYRWNGTLCRYRHTFAHVDYGNVDFLIFKCSAENSLTFHTYGWRLCGFLKIVLTWSETVKALCTERFVRFAIMKPISSVSDIGTEVWPPTNFPSYM